MNNTGLALAGVATIAVILGGIAFFMQTGDDAPAETTPLVTVEPSPSPTAGIQYPINTPTPAPTPSKQPQPISPSQAPRSTPTPVSLPPLDQSDAVLLQDAKPLFGSRGLPEFLIPDALIEHLVVTVENLDGNPIRMSYRPTKHVPGQPASRRTNGDEAVIYLTEANTRRYTPYVDALDRLNPAQTARLYQRYYPLFQQAYKNLGYPNGYFNDRLVAIIDHLLATPTVEYPIQVVQPKVLYEFADPALEDLSWGQKTLIRTGPSHMATIKRFLKAFRREITGR